jgi:hypothetical protein
MKRARIECGRYFVSFVLTLVRFFDVKKIMRR